MDLSYNMLRFLAKQIFQDLLQLDTLILANNQITHLNEECFQGLNKLKWLDLTDNELNSLPQGGIFQALLDLHLSCTFLKIH